MSRPDSDRRDDLELLDAVRAGDRAAMDALLRRHFDLVATLCRRLMSNRADAEDATQNALVAIVSGLPRFDGRSALTTWIHRVVTNVCLDELRRRARRPVPATEAMELAAGAAASQDPDPATRLDIDAALGQLPVEFRAPVVLRDLCALDYAEIAELLQIPPGTVRSRIARGRRALMEVLGNPNDSGVVKEEDHS